MLIDENCSQLLFQLLGGGLEAKLSLRQHTVFLLFFGDVCLCQEEE